MATPEQKLRERQAAGQALLDETTAVLDLLQNPRVKLTAHNRRARRWHSIRN